MVADSSFIEVVGNDIAQGDRTTFENFVRGCGLTPKAKGKVYQRVAESLPAEAGSFHFRIPSEGRVNITYYFEYGITTEKGVPPTTTEKPIALSVLEFIVNGFTNDCWVAIRYTAIKHPKHTTKTSAKVKAPVINRAISKVLTIPVVNNKGKVVITHQMPYLQFSDWIYIHVMGIEISGSIKG